MGPATSQFNRFTTTISKRAIGRVAIALQRAGEIPGDDVVQTRTSAAGFPAEKHVTARTAARPVIALPGPSVTGFQIIDRRFIHLHIAASHDAGANLFVNRLEPISGQRHPPGQSLPWQVNSVATKENLFLPIEGKMVTVFAPERAP